MKPPEGPPYDEGELYQYVRWCRSRPCTCGHTYEAHLCTFIATTCIFCDCTGHKPADG